MDSIIRQAKDVANISLKQAMPQLRNPMDEELEALLAHQKAKIKVVGCGGAGNTTINRMFEVGIKFDEFLEKYFLKAKKRNR